MDEYAAIFGKVLEIPEFRDYDLEWEFIKEMDKMADIKFDETLLVIDCNPRLIGENWIIVYEAQNDNKIGEI